MARYRVYARNTEAFAGLRRIVGIRSETREINPRKLYIELQDPSEEFLEELRATGVRIVVMPDKDG